MDRNYVKWVFCLEDDYVWNSGLSFPADAMFLDKSGVCRLEVRRNGEIRVPKEYAWDGCTPKVPVLHIMIGIPDGVVDSRTRKPKTYYASLVHDALYQFLSDGLTISRGEADRCFLRLMAETGFALRYPYYIAVRLFGGMFRWLGKKKRKTQGRMITVTGPTGERTA